MGVAREEESKSEGNDEGGSRGSNLLELIYYLVFMQFLCYTSKVLLRTRFLRLAFFRAVPVVVVVVVVAAAEGALPFL